MKTMGAMAGAGICLLFSLSSCSLLTGTLFPPELTRATAMAKLWDILPELEGETDYSTMMASLHGKRNVLALYFNTTFMPATIVLLDDRDLSLVKVLHSSNLTADLTPIRGFMEVMNLSVAFNGNFILGTHEFDPVTGHFIQEYDFLDNNSCGLVGSATSKQFGFVDMNSLRWYEWDGLPGYNALANTFSVSNGAAMFMSTLLSSAYQSSDAATGLRFLVGIDYSELKDPAHPELGSFHFPLGYIATPWSSNNGTIVPVRIVNVPGFSYDYPNMWITLDGIVIRYDEDGELVRFSVGGGRNDSIHYDSESKDLQFERTGRYFYEFSRGTGMLAKSATWWE
ncbi:MAG: hypothetical protein NT080_14225 [Spirochaetes bacterium]|nr:hypothetical protein [Spirochaetota bacterium]